MRAWRLQEAQNRLSELIDRALAEGPQVITRHGVEVAVVMPYEGYRKLMAPDRQLGEFLRRSPLRGSGLVIEREGRPADREIAL